MEPWVSATLDALGTAGFVLQHDVAHLRAIAVTDNHIIVAFQKMAQTLTSLFHILNLFLISTFLAAAQQCIATKSDHSEFFHLLFINLFSIL